MNHVEMLKRLCLTDHELKDLLKKFHVFKTTLNHDQQEAVNRSLPRLEQALKSFGPDVTKEDLNRTCCMDVPDRGSVCFHFFACKTDKDRD